jgi:hypothetical protein
MGKTVSPDTVHQQQRRTGLVEYAEVEQREARSDLDPVFDRVATERVRQRCGERERVLAPLGLLDSRTRESVMSRAAVIDRGDEPVAARVRERRRPVAAGAVPCDGDAAPVDLVALGEVVEDVVPHPLGVLGSGDGGIAGTGHVHRQRGDPGGKVRLWAPLLLATASGSRSR